MELGIGMFGDLHINKNGETQPAGQRLKELIEEIKLMDEVGIDFMASVNIIAPTMPYQHLK